MYLVFAPGETIATQLWDGPEPTPGQQVSTGSVVREWILVDGDGDRNHYHLNNGVVDHVLPTPPEPGPPGPDIPGFFDALVLSILQGAIPGDVFTKAQMILNVKDPTNQANAMGAFSQGIDSSTGQPYTVENKAALNYLIGAFHLALPTLPLE